MTSTSGTGSFNRWAAYATAFLANGAIMTVELVAGRVVSPHLGMSLYTWTSIIGVVMAGMSIGHYAGGLLADRFRARRMLALLFLLAAAGCASVLFTNPWAGGLAVLRGAPWALRIFAHTLLVFAAPAAILGAISPVVAKMALYGGGDSGRTMGGVFASGVAGSIIGTFATGFYLVPAFPVPVIVFAASGVLAFAGVLYCAAALLRREPAPALIVPGQPVDHAAQPWRFAEWFPPNATVFLSNAAFMAIEIAALRMVAREFGASLYSWTSVIGIVLAGISLGNFLGGRLSARAYGTATVMLLFFCASATALLTPLAASASHRLLSNTYQLMTLSWPLQITLYTGLTFLLPNIFIGMISPVVVKRALAQGHGAGRTVGNIYAWGAAGSILATFLSGYALIDWMGPRPLIALSAAALALTGLAYRPRNVLAIGWAAAAVFAFSGIYLNLDPPRAAAQKLALRAPAVDNLVYEDESQYSYIAVRQDPKQPNLRTLVLDTLIHSAVNLDDPMDLRYEYEQIYEAVLDHRYPGRGPLRSLVIGGGGFAFPRYLEVSRPGSHIEVAEIDPAVTEAAFAALGLPRDTGILIFNQDARNRVDDLVRMQAADPAFEPFDCIFGDSINDYTVPYHLTTLEFTRDVHALLKPDGVYMLNCIDIFDSGRFVGAVINTLGAVFESVHVFNTYKTPTLRDTFVVVGCKGGCDLEPLRGRTTMLPDASVHELLARSGGIVLTDHYAPVENLLAPVVRTQGGKLGELYFEEAQRAAAAGDAARALREAEKAVGEHPMWPEAWNFIARLRRERGDAEGTVEALRRAIDGSQDPAAAHHQLAQALYNTEQFAGAVQHWGLAVQAAPNHANYRYNLGLAHAALHDMARAAAAWEGALAVDPNHLDTMHNLALAYLITERYAEARDMAGRIRARGGEPDPQLLATLDRVAPEAPREAPGEEGHDPD